MLLARSPAASRFRFEKSCASALYNRDCMTTAQLRSLRRTLLRWYDQNRRDLPWRRNCDPYPVWVSEIMLQQTRVAAVLDHYARFLRRFPTVKSLAAARESSVLAMWSGLGYYHRARRMHQTAKLIARERRGKFPRTAEDWSALPGIGRYTAAAIASISFGEAVAVVDGNVERVLQRLHGWKRRTLVRRNHATKKAALATAEAQDRESAWQQADILLDREQPGDFNQAMMELGATICTPRAPQCALCPLNAFCKSRGAERRTAASCPETQVNQLRSRAKRFFGAPRPPASRRPAHGRHVGTAVAGSRPDERGLATSATSPFHHRHGLPGRHLRRSA
jgi:A/G-specific adenine glycosylase